MPFFFTGPEFLASVPASVLAPTISRAAAAVSEPAASRRAARRSLHGARTMSICNELRESHHLRGPQSLPFCHRCYHTHHGTSVLLWRIRPPDSIFCSQQPFVRRCSSQALRTAMLTEHSSLGTCSSKEDLCDGNRTPKMCAAILL